MMRWKMTLSYLPVAASVAKFLEVYDVLVMLVTLREEFQPHTLGVCCVNNAIVMSPRVVCRTTPCALSAFSRPVDGALFEGKDVAVGADAPPAEVPAEAEVDSDCVSLSFLNILLSLFILVKGS